MKKYLISFAFTICTLFFLTHSCCSQGLAVNTDGSTADPSAMLDVKAINKGVLVPRLTSTSNVTSPVTGLLVYQTGAPAGFYYYDGAIWVYLQNSDNANVTLLGNTFNGSSQLVQMNSSAQLPAVSGINLTNLNASNITSGVVNVNRLGTGASAANFLRGDNTWQPASGGSGQTWLNRVVPPAALTATFYPPSFFATAAVYPISSLIAPSAMTFDEICVHTVTTAGGSGSDAITITLYVNNVATSLSVTVTGGAALNSTANQCGTVGAVAVVTGDLINLVVTHTNSSPIVSCFTSLHAL
jgi:hypothetical protein